MNSRKYLTLVRREFWENRGLWMVPLVALGLQMAGVLAARHLQSQGFAFDASAPRVGDGSLRVGALSLLGTVSFLSLVGGLMAFAYLLESLYAERKDRSILFWKSLPVSDAEAVLTKFAVAMLVAPLGMLLLSLVAQPLLALLVYLRYEPLRPYIGLDLFAVWASMLPRLGVSSLFGILWYAPLGAWLMLASVFARRAPLAYAVLPPLVLVVWERLMLDSTRITRFLLERLLPWPSHPQLLGAFGVGPSRPDAAATHWLLPFQDPALWIGLAVAVGMLYITIRLRRYRDDT